ncbi:MAG TPA: acyl-CoA thioesterase [Phycisphaerales bacterium]|nr:acyl-CoA thioesterase [Phycisphaerales bacterium]
MPTPAPGAPHLALRVIVMPKDANPYGSIFGGVILSYIDQAAFVQARTHAQCRWVTLAMDRVEFKQPVFVGDTLNLYARTVKTGRSSVTVEIDVRAERFAPGPDGRHGPTVPVTSATLVMVAVDSGGKSVPFAEAGRSASAGESQW